jgi:stage V sporulation protein D (sporulation-specific penicillin-binding protein)
MKKKRKTKISKFPVRKINSKISKKLVGLFGVVILALIALVLKITSINITEGSEYRRIVLQTTQQQYGNRTTAFKRGDILDRNGTILATSERVYKLVLDCKVVNYEEEDDDGNVVKPYVEPTIDALVKVLDCDEDEIRERLTDENTKDSQYQVIDDEITMEEKEAFEDYLATDTEDLTKEEKEYYENINGVWFEESYKRVYPQNSIACDVIGFTNSLNEASWGIEGYYSDILNGENGRIFGYFNEDSDVEQNIIEPQDGNNVVSTIDVNIQQIIRKAIEDFQEKYKNGPNGEKAAQNIAVLVMDPNNGEILGMDSTDWYDLNDPQNLSHIFGEAEWNKMSTEEKTIKMNQIWRNYCISDAFEPGSTVKPMTVAAALETDTVSLSDKFMCDGYQVINGVMVRCSIYPSQHGELDVEGGIAQSCNDVMMQIGEKLGNETFLRYQDIFNFGRKTDIDLPGENAGILYTQDQMGELELATSTFGQGYTCTMVQEASAIASVINGGYYYKPHVVKNITDSSGNLLETKNEVVERQTVSAEVSDFLREAMGEVVETGTGGMAKVPGYSMGGKTGTAQKVPRDSGNYLVSFIGFAPLDDPEVLVYVVVDEPNVEEQDNSVYAQEISRQIFEELLPYMNIFVDDPQERSEYEEQLRIQAEQNAAAQSAEEQTQTENVENAAGVEYGISDTTIPEPAAQPEDETVQYGGNDIYSDGVTNDSL